MSFPFRETSVFIVGGGSATGTTAGSRLFGFLDFFFKPVSCAAGLLTTSLASSAGSVAVGLALAR
jgi:hypothetical protein